MTAQRGRLGAALGILLVSLPLSASPTRAGPLDDKRDDAVRIQAELDAQGERISVLDEEYNRGRLRVEETDGAFAMAGKDLEQAERRYRAAQARLARDAVDAYIHGGRASLVEHLAASDGADLLVRQQYLQLAAGNERRAIGDFRVAEEDLTLRRSQAEDAQRKARSALDALKRERSAIERAVTVQHRLLATVQGEVAQLLAAEQARRALEDARRVQRELADRQAADRARARQPAARTTAPTSRQGANPKPASPPKSAPPVGRGATAAVAEARRQIGKPYVWAAAGPDSFDCSGLTQWAWRAGGVRLSHSTYAQWAETPHIPISALQPGDLVYFGDDLHHMAIYSGSGMMIEAPYTGTTVRERPLRIKDLAGATRPG